ncbi:3-deoxy-manno-octulosonate cytidylyltransferase [Domibacillus epiphyticus]|uniref:3-deoxy-manno-octulosonate cytidylyltransferase n=1 Tax=Domibacillus epiphyticus TaxID=1714355 RepID=A0A1V2A546_9BACI|nr:3-deoxy-manno-octulosonate cytidylyltransferase [Domibacillus epiphyticus]OMP66115.1 3-deoxy-D-manno-octulosonate cytidylyltransferase [Domibacillus epiphyticus]
MKTIAVIPARFGSTRFPGKPLALIHGKTMIEHVYQRVKSAALIDNVIVATDHPEIYEEVQTFGGSVMITRDNHESGSDRIAEVAEKIEGDIFINIQGDEPLIHPDLIDEIVSLAKKSPESVITAKVKIENEEDIINPNVVKVVEGQDQNALYFSRSPIPYKRTQENTAYYKHLGIYCYPKQILMDFIKMPKSRLEEIEMLEQLRLIENGYNIKVIQTTFDAVGVDVPGDIQKVEELLGGFVR